jgi:MAGUK p55 subfamily protein 5
LQDEELKEVIEKARETERKYGHYLDFTLVNVDLERTYQQLIHEINVMEREPQWVPAAWLKSDADAS